MRLVPVGALKDGRIVAKTIYNEHNNVLLKVGVKLTDSLIEKLMNNQITSIYIEDDYSLAEIKDVISPELRNKAVKEVKKVFESVHKEMGKQVKALRKDKGALKKRLNLMADQKYFERITIVIEEMMKDLAKNHDAMVGLVDIKSMNGYLYQHAVQVAVLSLIVGADLRMANKELKELAISAMLHDIGLSMIDPKLWLYREDFTDEEMETYKKHPELGYEFIKSNCTLSMVAVVGILEHHESYDGTGYPLGIRGEKIHRNARIIAVADEYDRMTSNHSGEFIPQSEALEYIMGSAGNMGRFDIEIAGSFIRRIVPYPIGSYVKLSNGLTAVVVRYNLSNSLRPVLKIIEKEKPLEKLKKLDLMGHDHMNITIVSTVY